MRVGFSCKPLFAVILSMLCLAGVSAGQNASDQQEYQAAVSRPEGQDRTAALQNFAASHPASPLKIDALELIAWDARNTAGMADLEYWTGQLLSVAPNNPLAAAIIVGKSLNIASENRITLAKRTAGAADAFVPPQGFPPGESWGMKNFVTATLNGVVGYSFFEQKDYAAARPYLRKAVDADPRNAQYTYTLALCDLQGANPDQAEGYTMLARSVNLTKGTAAGDRLATYARQNFQQAGGTPQGWDQYLAASVVAPAAGTPTAPVVAANPAPATNNRSTIAGATTPSLPEHREPILVASAGSTPPAASAAAPPTNASAAPAPAPVPAPAATASADSERPLRVFPPRPARHIAPGAPVSIGVLIQASLATAANRKPVVFTLSDLVRHLREKDEAFIMSFSRGVVFQEDLTSNSKLLENAMDSIAPTPGSAMYDAVTFAAGHLDRVARNKNRILLVIAAEGDRDSTVSPLELSSEINLSGVTIYCVGVGVVSPADRDRLESLAGSTGGQAVFISDLSQFRQATRSIATGLGVSMPQ